MLKFLTVISALSLFFLPLQSWSEKHKHKPHKAMPGGKHNHKPHKALPGGKDDHEADYQNDCPTVEPVPSSFQTGYKNPCYYSERVDEFLCLPLVFLAGSSHGGAKELYEDLMQHKQVVRPDTQQPNWWTSKSTFGTPYPMYFQDASKKIEKHPEYITVDGSLSTLWDNRARFVDFLTAGKDPQLHLADCIKQEVPNAQIILMLRDPTTNFYFDYVQSEEEGKQSPERFHITATNAVEKFIKCFPNETFSEEHCIYANLPDDDLLNSLRAGIYVYHVEHFLKTFGIDQVLVLTFWKELEAGIERLKEVHNFLGLDKVSRRDIASYLHRESSRINPGEVFASTIKMLRNFYSRFNSRLFALLADKEFNYEYPENDWEFFQEWEIGEIADEDELYINTPSPSVSTP